MFQKSICVTLAATLLASSVAQAAAVPQVGDPTKDTAIEVLSDAITTTMELDAATAEDVTSSFMKITWDIRRAGSDGTLTVSEIYTASYSGFRALRAVGGARYVLDLCAADTLPEICHDSSTTGAAAWVRAVRAESALVDVDATYAADLADAWAGGELADDGEAYAASGSDVGGAIGGALGAIIGGIFGGVPGATAGFSIGTALGKLIGKIIDDGGDAPPEGDTGTGDSDTGSGGTDGGGGDEGSGA